MHGAIVIVGLMFATIICYVRGFIFYKNGIDIPGKLLSILQLY